MRRFAVWWLALGAVGCVESSSLYCASGRVCAPERVCDDVHDLCVYADQLSSCAGMTDAMPCTINGAAVGLCSDSLCVEVACGDGVVSGIETCDGATIDVNDCTELGYYEAGPVTCSASCQYDEGACMRRCGDGIVDAEELCEGDVPAADRDDCTEHGFYEAGPVACRSCLYDVSECKGFCGDGARNGNEVCDGNETPLLTCIDVGFERGRMGCHSCAADLSSCRHIGWRARAASGSADWQAAFSAEPGRVVVVGTGGAVLEVIDDQAIATTISNGGQTLRDVWGASDLFAVDMLGGIWRRSAGTWSASRAQTGSALHAIAGTNTTDVFAVGVQERVLHFTGAQWNEVHTGTGTLNDVWVAAGMGLAVGNSGLVLRRSGASWTPEASGTTQHLTAVWSDGVTAFAVGHAGTIVRYDGTWAPMASGVTTNLLALYGRSANDLYAVGASGIVLRFDGAKWWSLDAGATATFAAVTGNAMETFVAGTSGALLGSEASWTRQEIPAGSSLYGLVALGGARLVAAGSCNLYERGSAAWTSLRACTGFPSWDSMWLSADGHVFASENGTLHRHDGNAWTTATPLGGADVEAIWGTSSTDVWAVGGSFDGLVAHWNGAAWSSPTTIDTFGLTAVGGSSSSDIYAAEGDIWHWNGSTWTDVTPPGVFGTWLDVWAAGPEDVWFSGYDGKLLHRGPSGWTQWNTGVAISLVAISGSASDDVWAVGNGGAIFHFDGVAWSAVEPPVLADFFDIVVRPDLVVLAAWDDGIVALSRLEAAW